MKVVVQHNSGQFSDSAADHRHDAKATAAHAVDIGAWAVTGTESGLSKTNHLAHQTIVDAYTEAGFYVFAHKWGEWVALNRRLLHRFDHGFAGPFVPGTTGLSARQGGHSPRGIAWAQGEDKAGDLGLLTFGSTHWLTAHSAEVQHTTNARMVRGSQAYGEEHGRGSHLVFLDGDFNEHDDTTDLFQGGDFLTLADELGEHPKTHGKDTRHGTDIDAIASWRKDGRVKGEAYEVLDDGDLALHYDHFVLVGTFGVRPLHQGGEHLSR